MTSSWRSRNIRANFISGAVQIVNCRLAICRNLIGTYESVPYQPTGNVPIGDNCSPAQNTQDIAGHAALACQWTGIYSAPQDFSTTKDPLTELRPGF